MPVVTFPGVPAAQSAPTDLTGLAGWVADVLGALGAPGVGVLIALENIFPPIPSEVILPLAGFLSSRGEMSLLLAVLFATLGSVVGALVLYTAGRTVGTERLRIIADRIPMVSATDVDRADAWFARHGGTAVLFGRLVPLVRSLVSVPAGVQRMPLRRFIVYTAIGSAGWNAALIGGGYLMGSAWQSVGDYSGYLNKLVLLVLAAAVLWFVVQRLRAYRA